MSVWVMAGLRSVSSQHCVSSCHTSQLRTEFINRSAESSCYDSCWILLRVRDDTSQYYSNTPASSILHISDIRTVKTSVKQLMMHWSLLGRRKHSISFLSHFPANTSWDVNFKFILLPLNFQNKNFLRNYFKIQQFNPAKYKLPQDNNICSWLSSSSGAKIIVCDC